MTKQPFHSEGTRLAVIGPQARLASPAFVAAMSDLLDSVGNPQALLNSGLSLALRLLDAERGLVFAPGGTMIAAGFTLEKVQELQRDRLGDQLAEGKVHRYSAPDFAALAGDKMPVVGMSGLIRAPWMVCVLGVERLAEPFSATEQETMRELLRLFERALKQTARAMFAWHGREGCGGNITVEELPVQQLEPFPQFVQVERLLIQEAMARSGNNKTAAAAALGMTRDGLRKKMIRLGLLPGDKDSLREHSSAEKFVSFPAARN